MSANLRAAAAAWPQVKRDGTPAVTPDYDTWHLCVYVRDDELGAELSLLDGFSAGYFNGASERIFFVKPGEWKPLEQDMPDDGAGTPPPPHLLEAKGVHVFSLSGNTKNVDAFSLWRRGVPYVFLNTFKTAECSRFDAAHELGHLILHKHGGLMVAANRPRDRPTVLHLPFS